MAYAGQSRSRSPSREVRATGAAPDFDSPAPRGQADSHEEIDEPSGKPFSRTLEWGDAGLFGAGIALGVLIGAGAALLFAPRSGSETREGIVRGTRDFGYRASDAWEDLREELRHAATRSAKRLRRGVRRGRLTTRDLASSVRRPD